MRSLASPPGVTTRLVFVAAHPRYEVHVTIDKLALLLTTLAACGGGGTSAKPDATIAPDVVASDSETSCEGVALACEAAPNETCGACFLQIARCCYGDEDLQGMIVPLTASCEAHPACAKCCDECAKLDCAALKAANLCPTDLTGTGTGP